MFPGFLSNKRPKNPHALFILSIFSRPLPPSLTPPFSQCPVQTIGTSPVRPLLGRVENLQALTIPFFYGCWGKIEPQLCPLLGSHEKASTHLPLGH